MEKITAIVITFNEEKNITDCLESLDWCDEIIVIDSKSTDRTTELALKFKTKIILTDNISFSKKKNIGIEKASYNWILSVDADERITTELKNEILSVINNPNSGINAYYIKRKSYFISKFIKHCGWFPDYVLRLFKKSGDVHFSESLVHEKLEIEGKTDKLKSEILHFTDMDFEHYINKMNLYSTFSSNELWNSNKKTGILDIIFRPAFTFLKMYFLKLGFLDGYIGLVLCILSSVHVFVKYSKLYFLTIKN